MSPNVTPLEPIGQQVQQLNQSIAQLQNIASGLVKVASIFSQIISYGHLGIAFLQNIGLTATQSYAIMAALGLFGLLVIFRFLETITKIIIFLLILWVIGSIIGLI